jgi:hypothetical protein
MSDGAALVMSYMVDDLTSGFDTREATRARLYRDLAVPLDPAEADRRRRATWGLDDPMNADRMFADESEVLV